MPPTGRGKDGKLTRRDLHMKPQGSSAPGGSLMPLERSKSQSGNVAFGPERNISEQTGVSIFDPSLCELMYKWFSKEESIIFDPFAGGSVRGIVASKLKRNYIGIELRKEQVDANVKQAQDICQDVMPTWMCGDSNKTETICADLKADFILTCPPYADLERYSDDPLDISTMVYRDFLSTFSSILKQTVGKLRDNRFACIVIGEVRDKKTGFYYGLVPDTIRAMEAAGAKYYNEIILVTAVGSLPLRAGRTFQATRKIGKTHQNVLIFVKGDPKEASKYCGEIMIGEDNAEAL